MANQKDISRPLKILVTNDDGFEAKGIKALTSVLCEFGDVVVVAPALPHSGASGSLTPNSPLRLTLVEEREHYKSYKVSGTPVDCVKLSMHQVFKRKPDLLVSGINHGSNAGVSILYSGTMGAALEGCVQEIPSIGFSFCSHDPDTDFTPCLQVVRDIVDNVVEHGLPAGICLNVNIPDQQTFKGTKVCTQTKGHWTEEFTPYLDPHGRNFYWLTGQFDNAEPDNEETDEWALTNGYVAVVPCQVDMTATHTLCELKKRLE